jgi:hypothetical protein
MPYIYTHNTTPVMRAIILLILLATIVLFACKKLEKEEPATQKSDTETYTETYCMIPCADSYMSLHFRDYSLSEMDTVRLRVFEGASNFTVLQKDTMIYDIPDNVVYKGMDKNSGYEVTVAATSDVFRISGISYSVDSQKVVCTKPYSHCMNSLTGISTRVNGILTPSNHQFTGFAALSIFLPKP